MPISSISGFSPDFDLSGYGYSGEIGNNKDEGGEIEIKALGTGSRKTKKDQGLSDEEKKQVEELQKRDRQVRAHEQAHVAAGGQYVKGGAHYQFQKGPDGRNYAVGGEVNIDTSAVSGDPQATMIKMAAVQRAALAPADPSGQDRAVAGAAAQKEAEARVESMKKEPSGSSGKGKNNHSDGAYDSTGKHSSKNSAAKVLDLTI